VDGRPQRWSADRVPSRPARTCSQALRPGGQGVVRVASGRRGAPSRSATGWFPNGLSTGAAVCDEPGDRTCACWCCGIARMSCLESLRGGRTRGDDRAFRGQNTGRGRPRRRTRQVAVQLDQALVDRAACLHRWAGEDVGRRRARGPHVNDRAGSNVDATVGQHAWSSIVTTRRARQNGGPDGWSIGTAGTVGSQEAFLGTAPHGCVTVGPGVSLARCGRRVYSS
jgi:hypothetical protein